MKPVLTKMAVVFVLLMTLTFVISGTASAQTPTRAVTAATSAEQSVSGGVTVIQAVPLSELHSIHPTARVFATMQQARAALPANTIILGTLWQDLNLGGRDLVIYGSSCNNQGVSNLVKYNFNDITSSLIDGCHSVTLYFNTGYKGPQQTYGNGRIGYVGGAMNDQASSVLFHS